MAKKPSAPDMPLNGNTIQSTAQHQNRFYSSTAKPPAANEKNQETLKNDG